MPETKWDMSWALAALPALGSWAPLRCDLRGGLRGAKTLTRQWLGHLFSDMRADRLMPEISRVQIDQQGGFRRGTTVPSTMARWKSWPRWDVSLVKH
jgi:hypothetical protein